MKKVALSLLAFGLVGAMAFADDAAAAKVSIGAWGRGLIVPYVSDGNNAGSQLMTSWGGSPRVGFTIAGSSANMGFLADVYADNGTFGSDGSTLVPKLGDQQKIWAKPADGVYIAAGRVYEDNLRGSAGFGDYNWIRSTWTGDDAIFSRIGGSGAAPMSAVVILTPSQVPGLTAFVDMLGPNTSSDTTKNLQYGLGYDIAGVGLLRAQSVGAATDTAAYYQAAFKLTSVQNLYLDASFTTPKDTSSNTGKIAAYGNYTVDKAKINFLATYQMNKTGDAPMELGAGLEYALDGGIGFDSSLRYQNKTANDGTNTKTAVMLGVTKGFSNGLIGIGIQYSTSTFAPSNLVTSSTDDASKAHFAIPVKLEYWF